MSVVHKLEQSPSTLLEDTPGFLFNTVARLYGKSLNNKLNPYGVHIGQWPFLLVLWEEDGLTQKELSRRIRIEEPTTVNTVDRMERAGLVRRVRNENDRRRVNIYLTDKARGLEQILLPLASEVNDLALAGMQDEQRDNAIQLLNQMITNLENNG